MSLAGSEFLTYAFDYNNFLTVDQTHANAELDAYMNETFAESLELVELAAQSAPSALLAQDDFRTLGPSSGSDSDETVELKA